MAINLEKVLSRITPEKPSSKTMTLTLKNQQLEVEYNLGATTAVYSISDLYGRIITNGKMNQKGCTTVSVKGFASRVHVFTTP